MINKVHTIKFNDFMNGSYKNKPTKKNDTLYTISPLMFIDPSTLIIGGIVLGIVMLENFMESKGYYEEVERVQGWMSFVLPVGFIGGFIYYIAKSPVMSWL